MKRLMMFVAAVAVMVPASLWAQDVPKAEVFGGFSFTSNKSGTERTTAPGWQAAIAGNVNEAFSLVGDFGGHYKDGANTFEYMGGPRFTHRMEKASVFGHALFGGIRASGGGASSNGFAMGYGGGVDVAAGDNLAIRVVQFDWMPVRFSGVWAKNNVRFGFGVVWKSGS